MIARNCPVYDCSRNRNRDKSGDRDRSSRMGMVMESALDDAPYLLIELYLRFTLRLFSSLPFTPFLFISYHFVSYYFISYLRCTAFERHASTICHTPMAPQTPSLGKYTPTHLQTLRRLPLLPCQIHYSLPPLYAAL